MAWVAFLPLPPLLPCLAGVVVALLVTFVSKWFPTTKQHTPRSEKNAMLLADTAAKDVSCDDGDENYEEPPVCFQFSLIPNLVLREHLLPHLDYETYCSLTMLDRSTSHALSSPSGLRQRLVIEIQNLIRQCPVTFILEIFVAVRLEFGGRRVVEWVPLREWIGTRHARMPPRIEQCLSRLLARYGGAIVEVELRGREWLDDPVSEEVWNEAVDARRDERREAYIETHGTDDGYESQDEDDDYDEPSTGYEECLSVVPAALLAWLVRLPRMRSLKLDGLKLDADEMYMSCGALRFLRHLTLSMDNLYGDFDKRGFTTLFDRVKCLATLDLSGIHRVEEQRLLSAWLAESQPHPRRMHVIVEGFLDDILDYRLLAQSCDVIDFTFRMNRLRAGHGPHRDEPPDRPHQFSQLDLFPSIANIGTVVLDYAYVDFTENVVNEQYVPRLKQWIQGIRAERVSIRVSNRSSLMSCGGQQWMVHEAISEHRIQKARHIAEDLGCTIEVTINPCPCRYHCSSWKENF